MYSQRAASKPRGLIAGAALAAAAYGLVGCVAAPEVRVDRDPGADLSICQRMAWLPIPDEGGVSLTEQRMRQATLAVLAAKGYTIVDENPDCRITYSLSVSEPLAPRRPRVGVGVGGGSGGIGGGIGVTVPVGEDEDIGALTIDVVDVSRNQQVWQGLMTGEFGRRPLSAETAQEAVATILAEFPDRAP